MMHLRGDIRALFSKRCAPVVDLRQQSSDKGPIRGIWSPVGPKDDEGMVLWDRPSGQRERVEERIYAGLLALDLSDPTGRFHAREWLRERGHDLGNEDRADVLAWSVLSVHRGGNPLKVAAAWDRDWVDHRKTFRTGPTRFFYAVVLDDCWWINDENGKRVDSGRYPKSTDGRADCDAALLRLGWALTNADGSLTLPPLPEVRNG